MSGEASASARGGWTLRRTLVVLFLGLIAIASTGVGLTAYFTSYRIVDGLWRRLATQSAKTTAQRTRRFLEPAVPYLRLSLALLKRGRVDATDVHGLLDHFAGALLANPRFTWASFGAADGAYVAVHRIRGRLEGSWRTQLPAPRGQVRTRLRTFRRDAAGEWRSIDDQIGEYDPRLRPWYRAAAASADGVWVEPFIFATRQRPGFMYAARFTSGGGLRGVLAVEYEAKFLSRFLAEIESRTAGRVYVLTRKGLVVGHPEGRLTVSRAGRAAIARATDHPDPLLRRAWRAVTAKGGGAQAFELGDHLVMARPFPKSSGIDWTVFVVIPEREFFGDVRTQALVAAVIAAIVALLAILIGAVFSNWISKPLDAIAAEMKRVGRFDLGERPSPPKPSVIREIRAMSEATERMKSSLRSFGKYVPVKLVQQLMRSGQEAVLGVQERGVTTLFADIAGFSALAHDTEPNVLVDVMGQFLGAMSECVHQHYGTVDKYIGDAVMAFWGAPQPVESGPRYACDAALAMCEELARMREQWSIEGKPLLHVRIGIATGKTLVGNIGSPTRMNYTVLGDTVNLASRLEGLNKHYGSVVLMEERTALEVREELVVRLVDWVSVPGRPGVDRVYSLVGRRASVSEGSVEAVGIYEGALGRYRERSFAEAAELFARARRAFGGDDGPSTVMEARCRTFAESPPPESWDGNFWVEHK